MPTLFLIFGIIKKNYAGSILEPTWDSAGSEMAAAELTPSQIVPKDPYIRSNVDWAAWAFMKVEVK